MSAHPHDHHEGSSPGASDARGTSASQSPHFRGFVFPAPAGPGTEERAYNESDSDTTTATTSTADRVQQLWGNNAVSPVVVSTPAASAQCGEPDEPTAATAAPAATATTGTVTPPSTALHPTLPPQLNVEELNNDEAAAASPSGQRGEQRVRFALDTEDAPEGKSGSRTQPAFTATERVAGRKARVQSGGGGRGGTRRESTTALPSQQQQQRANREVGDEYAFTEAEPRSPSPVTGAGEGKKTIEPYSMITKTDGVHIGWYTQLLALQQRTARQFRRQIVTLLAEVLSPLLFVVLIIILNVSFGNDDISETVPAFPASYSYQINSQDYKTYLCYNDTARPINGLLPCTSLGTVYTCDGDESGIPVYGLCYPSYFISITAVVEQYLSSMIGSLIAVPTLDSIISHQWVAKKAGLAKDSRSRTALAALSNVGIGVSATTRYDSISYSGQLYFAPAANVPAALLTYIRARSAMFDYVYGGTFDTVAEAEKAIKGNSATEESLNSTWGLVVINDITDGFDVQIRLHGSALPTLSPVVTVEYRSGFMFDGTDMYLASGFLSLQKVLSDYFYSTKVANGDLPFVQNGTLVAWQPDQVYTVIGSFPWPKTAAPYLFSFASSLVAFILVLSFLYPFAQMTKRLVLEKELRIRESMCIMGLRRSSLWLNFFVVTFLEYLLICILLTILMRAVVAKQTDPFTLFLILFEYALTLIPLSGLLSTFFGRARMAALMSPLLYFVLSMPIFAMGSAGRSAVIGLSILSPTGLASLLSDVFSAESGSGFRPPDFHNPYFTAKPYIIMIMIACDFVLYTLLMFYLDAVLPQEWGTHKHPLFFITEPYAWCTQRRRARAKQQQQQQQQQQLAPRGSGSLSHTNAVHLAVAMNETSYNSNSQRPSTPEIAHLLERSGDFAPSTEDALVPGKHLPVAVGTALTASSGLISPRAFDPTAGHDSLTGLEKTVGVRICNLSKYFVREGHRFAAVQDVSWNMYRGEIAVLLGPNGAGKSTTINMVTGMLTADKGDCFIEGHSVSRHTAQARHEIGYCPQHNILWPDLTCREHLEFYGKIKGLRGADLEDAVVDILRAVDLEEKVDCIPTLMSGGQKRKLSVAIAFVGRNRVVLLDEPTAGMDPAARRHTWSLLRVMSQHHTIMLTTHYMDEADLLGDNVAIVNEGVLQCTGSTQFLRRYAGVGYNLRFNLSPIPAQSTADGRQAKLEQVWARLHQVVQTHLDNAELVLQTDAEVEYVLSRRAEMSMPQFLKEMESRGNRQLGLRSYALCAPTLEDVFMRVVEHQIPSEDAGQSSNGNSNSNSGFDHQTQCTAKPSTAATSSTAQRRASRSAADTAAANASSVSSPPGLRDRTGRGSFVASSAPLHRRISRASMRFYNNEGGQNYGDDVQPANDTEDEDEDEHLSMFGSPGQLVGASKNTDNVSTFGFQQRLHLSTAGGGGGGEEEEPTPTVFAAASTAASPDAASSAAKQRPPLAGGAARVPPPPAAMAGRSITTSDSVTFHTAASPSRGGGEMPREEREAADADAEAPPAPPPLDAGAVRNEAFLYKHVTDRHLDQVWATRFTSQRSHLWALQLRGMMYKRFFCAIRDRRMLFFQIICPVFCILLAMLLQLVKNNNNSTVYLSPSAFEAPTSMDVSGCLGYFGPVGYMNEYAGRLYDVNFEDPNFASSADMSYELLDTWYVHSKARYMGMQCVDSTVQMYMRYAYPAVVGSRIVSTILYNTTSHHSLPIALHTAYAMAYFTGLGTASTTFVLSVTSLPESSGESKATNAIAGILIGVIVLIPFTFLPANPVAWVVKEYESRARHLQTVSGLRYLIYWCGNFLFDFTAYVVSIVLVMIIFVIFQRSEYIGFDTIGPTIVAFALYGVCYCCGAYLISFCFSEHTTAQLVVLGASFLTGFLCVMLVFVLSLMEKTLDASNTLRWIFRLLPPYSIGEVILNLALLKQKKLTDSTLTAWSMSITVWPDIYMAAEAPVFAIATLLWDHPNRRAVVERLRECFSCCLCCSRNKMTEETKQDAADVMKDHQHAKGDDRAAQKRGGAAAAAITPAAQRRAAAAAGNTSTNNSTSHFADPNGAFLTSATRGAAHASEENNTTQRIMAASPNLRRRRTSASGSLSLRVSDPGADGSAEVRMPDGILVQSPTQYQQQEQLNSQVASPLCDQATFTLPTVLFAAPEADVNNDVSPEEQTRSMGRPGGVGASPPLPLNASVLVPPDSVEMIYPPPEWYPEDSLHLREEDSDVEEEREAVYKEERHYLAGRQQQQQAKEHNKKKQQGPTAATAGTPLHGDPYEEQPPEKAQEMAPDVIRVVDLRKVYDHPHKVAVSNLTFSVMHGEVFGFLGTNGAGKSSALSIITQEQLPTSGRAYVCGYDVVRDSFQAAGCLGYCPQFDACLDLLTVSEHIRLYALVRGVPLPHVEHLVTSLLTICNLTEHRNVCSNALSGGNRRKLSVAIALVGAPKVVCLDEPTAGMDPLARRLLWRALDRVSRKCSIILTTHHLEEVEALADCVGIMVDGGLRCFGDLPHLKHKYARNAYELTLRVSAAARQRALEHRQLQQATEAAGADRRGSGSVGISAGSPSRNGFGASTGVSRNAGNSANVLDPSGVRSGARRRASVSYAGTDCIDTSDYIFQFMRQHFPSALLIDNFNNERYVYTLPATRDVANALMQLQNQQYRRGSLMFRSTTQNLSTTRSAYANPIVRLSTVFETLQAAQAELGITEYSVSQVSLEQVFLRVCGDVETTRRDQQRSAQTPRANSATSPRMSVSSPYVSRSMPQPQARQRRSSSVFFTSKQMGVLPPDAASPSQRRLTLRPDPASLSATNAVARVTFAEYRRQRALLRRRADALMPNQTPSEAQRATEPDHDNSM